ncbi:unnamed protein product [Haemonchus placei]|uniref:Transposase n=1 Tax=Haemonchus placei TaxID=6290 RepID=A0A158QQH9_HAEPC|nr:unnamed protein product [Haemonchus placei]
MVAPRPRPLQALNYSEIVGRRKRHGITFIVGLIIARVATIPKATASARQALRICSPAQSSHQAGRWTTRR